MRQGTLSSSKVILVKKFLFTYMLNSSMPTDMDYWCPVRKSPSLHGRKSNPNLKFLGKAEAYYVCHIGPKLSDPEDRLIMMKQSYYQSVKISWKVWWKIKCYFRNYFTSQIVLYFCIFVPKNSTVTTNCNKHLAFSDKILFDWPSNDNKLPWIL